MVVVVQLCGSTRRESESSRKILPRLSHYVFFYFSSTSVMTRLEFAPSLDKVSKKWRR